MLVRLELEFELEEGGREGEGVRGSVFEEIQESVSLKLTVTALSSLNMNDFSHFNRLIKLAL